MDLYGSTVVQTHKAVTAHFSSQQIQSCGFTEQNIAGSAASTTRNCTETQDKPFCRAVGKTNRFAEQLARIY